MKDLTMCYATITPWMTQGLDITGMDLSIYSIIYSFTQDDHFKTINADYFCCFLKITRRELYYSINKLSKKGIIDVKKKKGKSSFLKVNSQAIKKAVEKTTIFFKSSTYKHLKTTDEVDINSQKLNDLVKSEHDSTLLKPIKLNPSLSIEEIKYYQDLFKHDWTYPGINFDSDSKSVK